MKASVVRVDPAGRVVLPKPLRDRLGLRAGSRLEIDIQDDDLRLRPLDAGPVLVQERGWWVHLGTLEGPLEDAVQTHRAERLARLR